MKRRKFIKSLGVAAGAVALGGVSALAGAPSTPSLDAALQLGDVFTIDGYFAFNPITQKATKHLQQFVVTSVEGATVTMSPQREGRKRIPKNKARPLGYVLTDGWK